MTFNRTRRHTTNIALSFAFALTAFMASNPVNACATPPADKHFSGDFGFGPPGAYVAQTQEDWEALWALTGIQGEMPNFTPSEQTAVAIFLGPRNQSGYRIEVHGLDWTDQDGVAELKYTVQEPQDTAAQVLTTPFALSILNRKAEKIVDEQGKLIDTPPRLFNSSDDS